MEKIRLFFLNLFLDMRGWTTEMAVTGASDIDALIPEFWASRIIPDGNRTSFWGALSGKEGSMMPCIYKAQELNKAGDQVTFNTYAQFMGTGVTGGSVLKGNEEAIVVGTFTVSADYVRHAVSFNKRAKRRDNYDTIMNIRKGLSDWWARKADDDIFQAIKDDSNVETLYANSRTSEATLVSGDYFGPTEINLVNLALKRQGATPLRIGKVNGRPQPIYGVVIGEISEYRLYTNTVFTQAIREGLERYKGGNGNHPLFNGALGMYRNTLIYTYNSLLQVPQGTVMRPETIVYATLTTAATTLSVGDADTPSTGVTPNYTKFFASSGSLQISDEIISYTGKTNNTFTGLTRGASSTTAAQHVPDALVTQRDIETVFGFGAEAIFRALPQDAKPIGEKDDYGFQIGLGLEAYYGQKVRIDARRGKAPSIVMMKVYSDNPGTV